MLARVFLTNRCQRSSASSSGVRVVHCALHHHQRRLLSTSRSASMSAKAPAAAAAAPAVPAIAFDIDGVLLRGKAVLPSARDALKKVTSLADGGVHPAGGIPHVYLTNGGGVTEAAKARQLSDLFDVHIHPAAVILSHTPMQDLVPRYQDELVLTLGMTNVKAVAEAYGFHHVLTSEDLLHKYPEHVPHWNEHQTNKGIPSVPSTLAAGRSYQREMETIAAILVMHDPIHWYLDLQLALDLLTLPRPHGHPMPRIFFSNPDFLFSGKNRHPRLAAGAFRVCLAALYKELTGRELEQNMYGKPHTVTYQYAERVLQAQARRLGVTISHTYGIGDNPASDIRGANAAGVHWSSVFVQSGSIARSAHHLEQPKFDKLHVGEAVDWILAGGGHSHADQKQ